MNQSLEIFLYDTALEMIFAYISNTLDEPTAEGFLQWNPNNTYHLIRQLLFTCTLAIMVSKLGNQNNNEKIPDTTNLWSFLMLSIILYTTRR